MGWPKGVPRHGYVKGTKNFPRPSTAVQIVKRVTPHAVVLKAASPRMGPPAGSTYDEIGRTGLKQVGGFLQEEFLTDLRGQKGARIYREMVDNSPDLGAFMTLVKRMLQQVHWHFEPFNPSRGKEVGREATRKRYREWGYPEFAEYGSVYQEAKRIEKSRLKYEEQARFFESALSDMEQSWPETLSEILTCLQYGYAPMEVVFKVRRGWSKDPRKRSKFDDGLISWRKMSLRAQESVFRWIYDEDERELLGFVQLPAPTYQQIEVPMEKVLNFRTDTERSNPEGRSLLRSAYWSWYWWKRLVAISAIGAERDLSGVPVMSIPAECMRPDATTAEKAVHTRARQIVENLRVDEQAGVVLPNQYDPDTKQPLFKLELLTTGGRGGKVDIDAMIKTHQTNMLRAVLSDWMMLGTGEVGSWALSSDRTDQFGVVLGGIMDVICGVFNRQAVPALAKLNGWDLAELPTLEHGDVESPDLAKLAEFVSKTMAAGAIGPDEDLENYLREAANLPPKLETDEETGVQTQRPAPTAPAPTAAPLSKPSAEETEGAPEPEDEEEEPEEPAPAPDQTAKGAFQPRGRRGTWAQGTGDVSSALELLRDRQRVGPGDAITHGFRLADTVPFSLNREMTKAVEDAQIENVEMRGLEATQPYVRRETVRAFVENPALVMHGQRSLSGTLEDLPVIVRHKGAQYIQDGHSRLAAKRLMGQQTALARVIDMGETVRKQDEGGQQAGAAEPEPMLTNSDALTQEEK